MKNGGIKKIIFMCINMNIGGTEKALLNMISEIPKEGFEVTILMLEQYGGFLNEVPPWVKIKYLDRYLEIKSILNNPPVNTIKQFIKEAKIIKALGIGLNYYLSKLKKDKGIFFKYVLRKYSIMDETYNLAVAYAGPMEFITYYVLNKIKAKKKAQWIHFDIEKIGFSREFTAKYYSNFNKIFVVSEQAKNKLLREVPHLESKVEVFYNIISYKLIRDMANKEDIYDNNYKGTKILSVGRLSKEKGQDLFILAIKMLVDEGYNVKGYCIGDGNSKKEYLRIIDENNLKDNFELLGSKINPYVYMKQCNIYVQPSRHEGYCITLSEAKCFNAPIVTTNFTGASEQIKNEEDGLIVDVNSESIYLALKMLLDNDELREKIKENLANNIVNESNEINKLLELV